MARFVFKLEPVLRQRRMVEDQAQRKLAQLLREQMILQTQIRRLQQTIVDDKRQMVSSLVGQVDVSRIRQHGAHNNRVSLRVQEIAMKLWEVNQQIDSAREQLIEASKNRKAVELLRDKQFQRWMLEQRQIETRQLDEFATQAYARRNGKLKGQVA